MSAFEKTDAKIVKTKPTIRDNIGYDFEKPQHPNAVFEIYCMDSSSLCIVSEWFYILDQFKTVFSDAKPYNKILE